MFPDPYLPCGVTQAEIDHEFDRGARDDEEREEAEEWAMATYRGRRFAAHDELCVDSEADECPF